MRLLSKLSAWIRSDRSLTLAGASGGVVDGRRLPQQNTEHFRRALIDGVKDAYARATARAVQLDPAVYALVIPPGYGDGEVEERRLADDLESAVIHLRAHPGPLSSLTWSTLRETKPPFGPDYRTWAEGLEAPFEGEAGLVFFVDIEAVGAAVIRAASQLGLSAVADGEVPLVRVSDGRYEARVGLHALVAEALWSARGPMAVVKGRARQLPAEMRAFQSLLGGLTRRFEGTRVQPERDHFVIDDGTARHKIDYRHLSASIRASAMPVDDWLDRATLQDLANLEGTPTLMIKSPAYKRAWPDALFREEDGYLLVVMREEDGRVRPILATDNDPEDRLEHHADEAIRQSSFCCFEARVFGLEEDGAQLACVVGDNVASIAALPVLLKGLAETVLPDREEVRASAEHEDVLVIGDIDVDDALVSDAMALAARLQDTVSDERPDPVDLDTLIELPEVSAGQFSLMNVSSEFFELLDEAERQKTMHPSRAFLLEGIAFREIGFDERAIRALERSVRADTDNGEANLALGQLLSDEGDPVRAVSFLERAQGSLPDRGDAANALGEALEQSGDMERAQRAYERAVHMEPDEVHFLVNLGRVYLESEDAARSRDVLRRALTLAPDSHDAHALLALALHKIGDEVTAKEHARVALEGAPHARWVVDLLTVLDDDAAQE